MSIQASRIMSGVVRPVIMTWIASMDSVRAKLCLLTVETLEEPRVFFLLFFLMQLIPVVRKMDGLTTIGGVRQPQTMMSTVNGLSVQIEKVPLTAEPEMVMMALVIFLSFSMVIPMNHVLLLVVMTDVLGVQKLQTMTLTKKWGFCKNDGYSLLLVAAHEFGHTIGLDHLRSKSALMYPTYSAVENFELPQDDINGARRLYGQRRSALPPLELERCGGGVTEGFVRTTTTAPNTRGKTRPNIKTTTQATTTRSNTASSDNVCDLTSVDAVLLFNPEIYVFKGYHFWRINSRNKAIRRGPYLISDQWPGGPRTVDAAYKIPQDEAVILFKGQRYWIFDSYHLKAGYPKYLSELGLPQSLLKVDLAVNWYRSKHRKRTYFFSGDQYFRYNELKERMDRRYPKNIVNWNMDSTDFDAAIEDAYTKRHTVFFRGNRVYLLHNYKFNIRGVYNLDAYLGCREETVRLARPAPIRDVNQP